MAVDDVRAKRVLLLGAIVALLFGLKLGWLPGTGPYGLDGAFYVNAARNVQEGVGLKTNVSMYHYGQAALPTYSHLIYPLWPLLLGSTARLVGLVRAVNTLPPFFYLVDLLLLYALTSRLTTRLGVATGAFTPGHVLVLLFGLNFQFFGPTTFPYTEGLGFFFAFLTLLLLDRSVAERSLLWASLASVAAGLALLTRTQMVIVGLAVLVAFVWAAISDRRFLAGAAAYAVIFGAIAWSMNTFVLHIRESPRVELPLFKMWIEPATTAQWWRERFTGLVVAFSPFDGNSFFNSFHAALLIPIIGAAVAIVRWLRGSHTIRLREAFVLPAAAVLIALATFFSLDLFHQDPEFLMPWLFGYRHGLPMIFGVAVATVYLWKLGRAARYATVACAVVAMVYGGVSIVNFVTAPPLPSPTAAEATLGRWLDNHPSPPQIITARAQHLSVYTHANVHWTECRTPATTTRIMLERLPVDYVVVYAAERQCPFVGGLGAVLVEVAAFGEGGDRIHVFGRRRSRG